MGRYIGPKTKIARKFGEAIFGTVLEIICLYTISVPATWVAGMVLHLPFLAVFAFLYTDELIRLVFELCYTASGKWVKPVTQEGRATLEEFHEQMAQRRKKKQREHKLQTHTDTGVNKDI